MLSLSDERLTNTRQRFLWVVNTDGIVNGDRSRKSTQTTSRFSIA